MPTLEASDGIENLAQGKRSILDSIGGTVHNEANAPKQRLAELVAALSLATDLGTGEPMEYALRTSLVAVSLGETLALDDRALAHVYYVALLRVAGCTAIAHDNAMLFGNEITSHARLAALDLTKPADLMGFMLRHVGEGRPVLRRAKMIAAVLADAPKGSQRNTAAVCEVAQQLADRLKFGAEIRLGLGHVFERWDGRGLPGHIKGDDVSLAARIVRIASDAETFHQLGGPEAAVTMVRRRAGSMYDPRLAEQFCQQAPRLYARLNTSSLWKAVLDAEPGERRWIPDAQIDEAVRVIADFTDLKSPYTLRHSTGVSELAEAAARRCGFAETEAVVLRRAALLHDLGRTAISNEIWDKPGSLTDGEWEQVRLHPYYTERILARPTALANLGTLAALHHERLDGSGYHRGLRAPQLSTSARLLAAADVYHAMTEARPHRPARSPEQAADELRQGVIRGRIDSDAANAVLAAAGHRVRPGMRERPAGLTDREVEVLRLLAHGLSNREMAAALGVSAKTVGHHIEHIYNKIGVSTRPAATVFAMRHDLLEDPDGLTH